ncbi:MAG: tetratricopeptide repeat protein [Crocinitomicaceae bacterium]|nr:tetratricopeptide repeat protein [Crocinitomicaceae bacterium]
MNVSQKLFIICALLLVSCGTVKKNAPASVVVSAADYGYIQHFHEGIRYKTTGQFDEAIRAFEQCLAIKQTDDAVYYALSQIYLGKKELAKSADCIQKAAKIDPTNIWYAEELAYMFVEQKKYAEANVQFEKLIKNEPRNVEWMYSYAESLAKDGKWNDAIKALTKTEDLVGAQPELTIEKFRLYIQAKQTDKALNELLSARKKSPNDPQLLGTLVEFYFQTGNEEKGILLLEDLVKVSPENGRAHLALADIYRQKNERTKSMEQLKLAFSCEDVDFEMKMKILITLLETAKTIDQSVMSLVDQLVINNPTQAKAHSIQGDFYLRQNKENEALYAYKKALEFDQNQYPIWNQVLLMEYQSGAFEILYNDSKKCLELFPTIPTIYLLNGVSAVQLKKHQEAIDILKVGKESVVNDPSIEAEMLGQIGEAYFCLNQVELGKENYKAAIAKDPQSLLLRNNYAYRLALAKIDLEYAYKLAKEISEMNPKSVHFIDTKGFVLFQMGNFTQALNLFELAYTEDATDKLINEHLGDAYFFDGDIPKAVEMWERALKMGATNKNLPKKITNKKYYDPIF